MYQTDDGVLDVGGSSAGIGTRPYTVDRNSRLNTLPTIAIWMYNLI